MPNEMFSAPEFFELEHTAHSKLFETDKYVWEALKQIPSYLQFRLKPAVLGELMGNSCEFKNCIVFDEAQIPHFSYVGDSILGYKVHLGAGVILSNVKLDHAEISVLATDGMIATGLRKFGAIIGD